MAEISPFRTLRYDPGAVSSLEDVIAPPYDVIDDQLRAGAAGQEPGQRGGDRPARVARGRRPLPARSRDAGGVAPAGRRDPRARARTVGARAGLHSARRLTTAPARAVRARARGGLRGRPDPPARAHAPWAQGGPAAPHPGDPYQPLPHLQPLPGPRQRGRRGARRRRRGGSVRHRRRSRGHPEHACGGSRNRTGSPAFRERSPTPNC